MTNKSIDENQTTSKSADGAVFKVPAIPRKKRKLQKNASPNIDPAIMANINVINKMASPEKMCTSPSPIQQSSAIVSPPKKLDAKPDDRNKSKVKANHDTPFSATKIVPLTGLGVLFNAVIENNTHKVTDYVRTSLTDVLHEFWDTTKPTQQLQKLQDQLATMRSTCGGQLDVLQNENKALKRNLNVMNGKYDVQLVKVRETMRDNAELTEILCATKSKMAVLTEDLKKSISM